MTKLSKKIALGGVFPSLALFFILLLVPLSVSASHTINLFEDNPYGLQVEKPNIELSKFNSNFEFNFHVFNLTSGLMLNSSTTNCSLRVYNQTGQQTYYNSSILYDSTRGAYSGIITNSTFNSLGQYSIITICNTTALGGFNSFPFEITTTGQENSSLTFLVLAFVGLIILLLGFVFKDNYLVHIASWVLFLVGIYTLNYGFGFELGFYTTAISIVITGLSILFLFLSTWALLTTNSQDNGDDED